MDLFTRCDHALSKWETSFDGLNWKTMSGRVEFKNAHDLLPNGLSCPPEDTLQVQMRILQW
jgi:hypothetical protein